MILFAPVYWIANGFLDQMAPSFSINNGLQYFKKKGGGYSEVPYERMICVCIKKRNLMPLIVVFTSILKFRVKWRYTLSFMFVLCIFKDDGWPIFLWPWSVLIHKLSTPLHDFFLTLQVVSGLHLLRCMWKIVCEGKLLPCLFEGIDYYYYFIKFMGFLMFFYIIQLESIVYD